MWRPERSRARVVGAAKRTLDGEDARPRIPVMSERNNRCFMSFGHLFSCWPGCRLGGLVPAPPSIRVRRTGTPDATCAINASGNQLGEAHPFYRSGFKPRALNGRFHQLENIVDACYSCFTAPIATRLLAEPFPIPDSATNQLPVVGPSRRFRCAACGPLRSQIVAYTTDSSGCRVVDAANTRQSRSITFERADCPFG